MVKLVFLAFLICFTVTSLVFAQQSASSEEIIIDNSGSTNFSGYRIIMEPSGQVSIVAHGRASLHSVYADGQYKVSPEMVKGLMDDLNAVMPISVLKPAGICAKSVSFGTKTFVTYKGQTSVDIQCMGRGLNFINDINAILKAIPRADLNQQSLVISRL